MVLETLQDENYRLRAVTYPSKAYQWMLYLPGEVFPSGMSHSLPQVLRVLPAEWFSGNCPLPKRAALVKMEDPP